MSRKENPNIEAGNCLRTGFLAHIDEEIGQSPNISCSKRNKIKHSFDRKMNEPNNVELEIEETLDQLPGIGNLRAGAERMSMIPDQVRIEESPVAGSEQSFGEADESEYAPLNQKTRMANMNRENERMRRILDSVQDQIQLVWDRGHRVKITIDAIERRKRSNGSGDRG